MAPKNKQEDRRPVIDTRLSLQIVAMALLAVSAWYGGRISAAVDEEKLITHIEQVSIHPNYQELTKEFIPRGEMVLQLGIMDKRLENIEIDIDHISKSF